MKHLFIVNPAAGKGKALKIIPFIRKILEARQDHYEVVVTEYPGHATEVVRSYTANDCWRVYSVGGDGTLNEVLNGLAGNSSSLGIIPCGSGNDFIKSLIPSYELGDLIAGTLEGEERQVDLAKVNGRYYLNISSLGFDAEVAYNAQKFKRLPMIPGRLGYLFAIFYTLLLKKSSRLSLKLDEQQLDLDILLLAVANGRFYGGGMLPAPHAKLDDGLLDICLVRAASRPRILKLFPLYMKGKHENIPEVSFHRCTRVEVLSRDSLAINIDGEVQQVTHAVFEIIPAGVKVILPRLTAPVPRSPV